MPAISGPVRKLKSSLDNEGNVAYQLPIGDQLIDLNPLIGKSLKLTFLQKITCCNCDKKIKKSYSQGYCYPCMLKLAQCDMCIY